MKYASLFAALGAIIGVVSAHVAHNHEVLHRLMRKDAEVSSANGSKGEECGCFTSVVTWYGEATLVQPATVQPVTVQPTTTTHSTTTHTSTSYSTVTIYATDNNPAPYTSFSSTGVYTIPATTITLTSTVVVPCPTATSLDTYAPGTYARHETTVTVTATNSIYICPFTSAAAPTSEAPAAPPAPPPAAAPPAPAAPPAAPAPAEPAPAAPNPATPSYEAPKESQGVSPPSNAGSGSAPISSNGNKWAMTYSPYTAEGKCKGAGAVLADISAIKSAGFTTVRLYSTDCSGLENVGNACTEYNLKLVLGIFIDKKGIDAARPQITDIISWGKWQMVELIVIGNEALFNKYCDASALASFIAESKASFQVAGYTGPCTTTETLNVWEEVGSSLCSVIDVIGANIHPFFNAEVSPSDAGSFTAGQIDILREICPGKEVYNLESGWPHGGGDNGKATPGYDHQRTAITSIMEKVGAKTIFFSFEDDMWKKPGQFGVEQSWGCNTIFSG